MNDAYNPHDIDDMTAEPTRWTEPIVWASTLEKLDQMMRDGLTKLGYM